MKSNSDIQIGALIKISEYDAEGQRADARDNRRLGTILRDDTYTSCALGEAVVERIVEVLWQDGQTGWILKDRVEVIHDQ